MKLKILFPLAAAMFAMAACTSTETSVPSSEAGNSNTTLPSTQAPSTPAPSSTPSTPAPSSTPSTPAPSSTPSTPAPSSTPSTPAPSSSESQGEDLRTEYVFEAEFCTSLEDLSGSTWSGGTAGYGLIGKDRKGTYEASNGYFVHFNYIRGNLIEWHIESDREIDDLTFVVRFAAEYRDFPTIIDGKEVSPKLRPEDFVVALNENPFNYEPMTLMTAGPETSNDVGVFQDFELGVNLHLNDGENVVQMLVNNDILMQGTALSSSPCIDCIKMTTAAELTWLDYDEAQPSYVWAD